MTKRSGPKGNAFLIVLVVVMVATAAFAIWYQSTGRRIASPQKDTTSLTDFLNPQATPAPQPTVPGGRPLRPLPSGSQTYLVSGNLEGPIITEVTIDPVDASPGQNQTITIKAQDSSPVTSVSVTVTLDTESKAVTHGLSLVSGTTTNGTWQVTAPFPDDTNNLNYTVQESAVSASGTSTTTTTIR